MDLKCSFERPQAFQALNSSLDGVFTEWEKMLGDQRLTLFLLRIMATNNSALIITEHALIANYEKECRCENMDHNMDINSGLHESLQSKYCQLSQLIPKNHDPDMN